jgi:hypothetical protein
VIVRLVIPEALEQELRTHLLESSPLEKGAALLLGTAEIDDGVALLAREMLPAPPDGFRIQGKQQWAPATSWLSRLVGMADEKQAGIAIIHSHPMSADARRSPADHWADEIVAPFFVDNLPDRPFASLVLTSEQIAGAAWIHGKEHALTEVRIIGAVIKRTPGQFKNRGRDEVHSRQELLFGVDGQMLLATLTVGVVGVGGTGSAVAEQLVRMGVGRVVLFDHDLVDASNVSRMYGSRMGDVGRPKVAVVSKALEAIGTPSAVTPIQGDIRQKRVVGELTRRCDLVFGCTDSHSSRAVLNDVAYQYMIPVIDMGIRVGIGSEGPTSAPVEVRVLRPSLPCLWCYGAIDGRRVAEELMDPGERTKLEKEGYVQRGQPVGTIIPYTTLAASLATSRFLGLATGISTFEPGVFVFDAMTFDGWAVRPDVTGCVCRSRTGLGDARPVWMRDTENP